MFGRKKSVETITSQLWDTIKDLEHHAAHQAEQAAEHAVKIAESTVAKDGHQAEHEQAMKVAGNLRGLLACQ